jgi:hypothetical protein
MSYPPINMPHDTTRNVRLNPHPSLPPDAEDDAAHGQQEPRGGTWRPDKRRPTGRGASASSREKF